MQRVDHNKCYNGRIHLIMGGCTDKELEELKTSEDTSRIIKNIKTRLDIHKDIYVDSRGVIFLVG